MNTEQKKLFANGMKKMKKNAMDKVDYEEEKRKDPKYKTELCKKWVETGFCVYGNKCRFAHGKNELVQRAQGKNYKKKQCKSFQETGFCPYGSRCNFKHDERKLSEIVLPYFYINLFIKKEIVPGKRLHVFEEITNKSDLCSVSTLSDEENLDNADKDDFKAFSCVNSVLNFVM